MTIKKNLGELIGNTPILEIESTRSDWKIYLKLEYFNPAGSFRDRTAYALINAAENAGTLKKGMTLFESSSGNTAKALAMICAARGYKFIAIVDQHAPTDKLNAIKAYGGNLHFCVEDKNSEGGHFVDVRREISQKNL